MEHIDGLYLLIRDNQLLIFGLAIVITFLESFIPALPLVGIVITNAALLGFVGGVISSSIGSCLGTLVLFIIARKFSNVKFIKKLQNDKTDKVTNWIKNQNYIVLFLCYSCVFIPGCLVTVASGFSGRSLKSFIPGMVLGKITMFAVASFIGYDINLLFTNPERIIVVLLMVVVSFIIGRKMSLNMYEDKCIEAN